ncbi:MAG: hypothetical protein AVO33_10405 [delta proteobacterium ML8_F1]|nr:MAG: hypothetical protein AVO33_10405 [delta proteobacterium ML8_F1]
MKWIKIGKIVNTKGVKGQMKIYPYTNEKERFEDFSQLYVRGEAYRIESVAYHKNTPIIKLEGIDTPEAVNLLKNEEVLIPYDEKPELEADEYLIMDLIGLEVYEGEALLGRIQDVIQQGPQDLYVVKGTGGEILIPGVKRFIREVNIEKGYMKVALIEGMR